MGWKEDATALWEQYGKEYPLDFILGWISRESNGVNGPKGNTKAGEAGWFQIHPTEAAALGIDLLRVNTDETYSFQQGIALANHYAQRVSTNQYTDSAYYGMVKLGHTLPLLQLELDQAVHETGKTFDVWEDLYAFARDELPQWIGEPGSTKKHNRDKWLNLVSDVFSRGAMLVSGMPAAVVSALGVAAEDPFVTIPIVLALIVLVLRARGKK